MVHMLFSPIYALWVFLMSFGEFIDEHIPEVINFAWQASTYRLAVSRCWLVLVVAFLSPVLCIRYSYAPSVEAEIRRGEKLALLRQR